MKFRITVDAVSHTPHDVMKAQAMLAIARGIPLVRAGEGKGKPLAVVGGGHPVDMEALRKWDGDIWACNGMHDWLLDNGISSTLFMMDPHPCMADYVRRAERAVLASICHPTVFDALEGKDVSMFHIGDITPDAPFIASGGGTAAGRAHRVGMHMLYSEQHYFGCSGSYVDVGRTGPVNSHVYPKPEEHQHPQQVIIKANGEYFRTDLALMQQCEFFVWLFAQAPEYFIERSGGLLRAMIADPDWSVTHATPIVRKLTGMADYVEAA